MYSLSIKPCLLKDFPKVLPIIEAHSDSFNLQDKRQFISVSSKILNEDPQGSTLFTAWHEGILIGFLGFKRNEDNPNQLELFGQCVKRGYQGQGIGTTLALTAITQLKQQGTQQIRLHLKSSLSPKVKNFYHSLGFKPTFDESYTGSSIEDQALVKVLN